MSEERFSPADWLLDCGYDRVHDTALPMLDELVAEALRLCTRTDIKDAACVFSGEILTRMIVFTDICARFLFNRDDFPVLSEQYESVRKHLLTAFEKEIQERLASGKPTSGYVEGIEVVEQVFTWTAIEEE